jgi:hypothetical protein
VVGREESVKKGKKKRKEEKRGKGGEAETRK